MDFSVTNFESRVEGGFFIITKEQDNTDLDPGVYSRTIELPVREDRGGEEEPKEPRPIHRGKDQYSLSKPKRYNRETVQQMSPEALAREWPNIWDNYDSRK